ncbi:hypothetical protein B0H17DRAFT_704105 [Mycena rosella]|uniref:F-box domain-containing protein n=1 Tax=Mycena rosella TaxID=1033263 RepID=A0AAD7DAQ3_MYCRO|nr:hypothetical protein B0H17DRAFT_704105 [Mycena rosella]
MEVDLPSECVGNGENVDIIRPGAVSRHPILEVPPEILSEIFIECLPIYSATPDPWRAPLLLGAICRDWRKTALSTPRLWSSFILPVNLGRVTEDSGIIQLFEYWLFRGGSCPLTMVISCYHGTSESAPSGLLPASLLRALSDCSSRWHDVNLVLPFADFYRLQTNEGLPLLSRLAIKAVTVQDGTPDSTPPSLLELFGNAPVLQDVHLGDGFSLSIVTLPLSQLRYFDSRMATTHHYLHVLRQTPNLVEIALDLHTLHSVDMPSAPIYSNIKSLTLRSFQLWENTFLDVLGFLACPALETLVITGYAFAPISPEPLLRFLSRSSPPLREFVVDFPHSGSDALIHVAQCLIGMSTLVRLDIKCLAADTVNDIFSRMCENTSVFLPKLQMLKVVVNTGLDGPSSWTYDAMTRMLFTRWNSQAGHNVGQLQVFSFSYSNRGPRLSPYNPGAETLREPDSVTLLQLSTLAQEGMVIDIDLGHNGEDLLSLD